MSQVIRIPSDLYQRLEKHAVGFASPASVIEKLLNFYEGNNSESSPVIDVTSEDLPEKLEVVFYPSNEEEFKSLFLTNKVAWILLRKTDGNDEWKQWALRGFTSTSSVMGNLRSGYLRDWKKKGIIKAEVAINKHDITE